MHIAAWAVPERNFHSLLSDSQQKFEVFIFKNYFLAILDNFIGLLLLS